MRDGVRCEKLSGLAQRLACRERIGALFTRRLERLGSACVDGDSVRALERDAELLSSQIGASLRERVGRLTSAAGQWNTEIVMDLAVTGAGFDAPAPDVAACRAVGQCPPNILITQCTTEIVDGGSEVAYSTTCRSAPESGFELPPYTVEPDLGSLSQIDDYTWRIEGATETAYGTYGFEARYTLGPGGNSISGVGVIDRTLWTFFVTGHRVP
jgi:hypothetical protein